MHLRVVLIYGGQFQILPLRSFVFVCQFPIRSAAGYNDRRTSRHLVHFCGITVFGRQQQEPVPRGSLSWWRGIRRDRRKGRSRPAHTTPTHWKQQSNLSGMAGRQAGLFDCWGTRGSWSWVRLRCTSTVPSNQTLPSNKDGINPLKILFRPDCIEDLRSTPHGKHNPCSLSRAVG